WVSLRGKVTASACCTAAWPLVSAVISCQLKGSRGQPSEKDEEQQKRKEKKRKEARGKTYRRPATGSDGVAFSQQTSSYRSQGQSAGSALIWRHWSREGQGPNSGSLAVLELAPPDLLISNPEPETSSHLCPHN
ncbi:hypothetical protein AMELA_G00285980, partial [Ameiurus melas]